MLRLDISLIRILLARSSIVDAVGFFFILEENIDRLPIENKAGSNDRQIGTFLIMPPGG